MGIKVLLGGAGGDDIFSGYRRHVALEYEKYWNWMPKIARSGLKGAASFLSGGSIPGLMQNSSVRKISKAFAYADSDDNERIASYFLWGNESLRRGLYSDDFTKAIGAANTCAPLLNSLNDIPDEKDPLNKMLYLELKHFLADHNLNYTDKMSMAAGVEVRVPLLDLELVRWAVSLPPSVKQKGTTGKYIFKKAMEPYLPKNIIYRPKTGFGAPLRTWIKSDLKSMVDEYLSIDSLRSRGLFSPEETRKVIALNENGDIDASYNIFSLLCIEIWCRQFIDDVARFRR